MIRKSQLAVLIVVILIVGFAAGSWILGRFLRWHDSRGVGGGGEMQRLSGVESAPEFPAGMEWLDPDRPIRLADLRGKVIVLDFWTYCCINCMHILPDLKRLEQKYPNELVIIGVHSAKFTSEKDTDNIREAILRYEIEHPVLNDRALKVWDLYGARSWPTLFVISPAGKIVGFNWGEGAFDELDPVIAQLVAESDRKKTLDRTPLKLTLERSRVAETLLSFPGKVLADAAGGRLFISDSNHNRIVITSLEGAVQDVIGRGAAGLNDGAFAAAEFNHPQGLALAGEKLYIADTENHAIRCADLAARTVVTVAGTGAQGREIRGGTGARTALNSPWDVAYADGMLYIAMAGFHQIWRMDLQQNLIGPFAGSSQEDIVDGPLERAALAQPSGLATDGKTLFVADSEVSGIRSIGLERAGEVRTLVGRGLFEFGDRDGAGDEVRLQHPLGVALHENVLFVANTYNNKIKKLVPATRQCETFLGAGQAGNTDGPAPRFNEPGGLSTANGKLYIADTNNHVIRVADLATRSVTTLKLENVEKLRPAQPAPPVGADAKAEKQSIRPGAATLTITVMLPARTHLNADAPSTVVLSTAGPTVRFEKDQAEWTVKNPRFPLSVPLTAAQGAGAIHVALTLYYCSETGPLLCYLDRANFDLPVVVTPEAAGSDLKLSHTVRLAK